MSISIWYSDGPGAPTLTPFEAARLAGLPGDEIASVTLGWTLGRPTWIKAQAERGTRVQAVMAGYGLGGAVASGHVIPLPIRLSAVPGMIASNPPELAVVAGVRRGSRFAFGPEIGWASALARAARRVVVEVDEQGFDFGADEITGNIVATAPRRAGQAIPVAGRTPDEVDRRIGARVAALVPADSTLQFGPGGIGEAIVSAIDRPVRIWSGLVTDAVAQLHADGHLAGPALTSYTWGSAALRALAAAGMLHLRPCEITHDLTAISATPRFVACNTALQVGLDGSVNVERVGGRVIAAIGGHADFCVGASRSAGGASIIALRSTTQRGDSTIVPAVEVVSTARSDVQFVVTEYGTADLRSAGTAERAARLIDVAAPQHRAQLAEHASC